MRVGIVSPVVTTVPGAHAPWERSAGITELVGIARAADTLGFDHLTCSELLLGYHHPLEIAKRYGTLDRVSGVRLVLGLGVGSLEEEFDLLGARFVGRGAVADEAIAALRASLSRREPAFHGAHFDFSGFVVEPHAQQERVPLRVGGRTPRSLRRATTLADGWVPFGLPLDQLRSMLDATELPEGFEVVLGPGRPLDPGGEPTATTARLAELGRAGATLVSTAVRSESPAHYVEQLEALAQLVTGLDLDAGGCDP